MDDARVPSCLIRERIRSGETVSESEYAAAVFADTTRADLDTLALRLTASAGIEHRVWRTRGGDLAVYTDAYKDALGLAPV